MISQETSSIATQNSLALEKSELRQDADREQYVSYIETIARIIDKLQKDNPQIKVPKAAVFNPPGKEPKGDGDLDRPKYEHPKADLPTPTPRTKTVIKYKSKPKPTPKPWFQFFKSTR